MSSTNRGGLREVSDYYVTPVESIKEFLTEWLEDDKPDIRSWFDPCAGGDVSNDMSYPRAIKEVTGQDTDTLDIREDSRAQKIGDYLSETVGMYDVIISNPPFSLAQEFITKALRDVKEGGYVIMLLRLNFLESKRRKDFFDNNMPHRIYVHHKRMSFQANGKTDSVAYMHAVWKKGERLIESKLKII